ncbi:MAG TPA: hypothetical protein VHE34_24775 [Puia sp.]|uniref:hypothetical protein n=1 Tax=Puia sp. TaxID=2045100 RepID=UPI002B82ABF9|nr:hypothetical protein [Puia sp.]HVU98471.1 hypothetical protein [Puia sp.]
MQNKHKNNKQAFSKKGIATMLLATATTTTLLAQKAPDYLEDSPPATAKTPQTGSPYYSPYPPSTA